MSLTQAVATSPVITNLKYNLHNLKTHLANEEILDPFNYSL